MDFRKIIVDAARARGWTAYRLAKESGVPMRTVQKYFAGDSDLVGERIAKLAQTLQLELRPMRSKPKRGS